ncbi:MAG: hypothetical protein H6618_04095 [Deltaproteobacteria bacterium]|nr:hypothetical protein [Deltaproteobacteria bacterium]
MSEELVKIDGRLRSVAGKGHCRRLRAEGKIPGNILEKSKSTLIEIDGKLLSKAWKSGKRFSLNLNGQERVVKIQELQINPVKRTAFHVDLMYE